MIICPICKSNSIKIFAPYRFQNLIFSCRSLASCSLCELVFASPMPKVDELATYNHNYFLSAHAGKPTRPSTLAFFSGIARLRLDFIKRYIKRKKISVDSILEIGPGLGMFAKAWNEEFPHNTYFVVESDSSCHESLKHNGAQLVKSTEKISSDLIILSHVLEHLPNPFEFIKSVSSGLKRGGAIFVEVPCQDWKYKALDEPHVLFFDKKSLTYLLYQLGFNEIEVSYFGEPINKLILKSKLVEKLMMIRTRLISFGIVLPFSRKEKDLDCISCPLERAVVKPFLAHQESDVPARWLRAVARKV